MLNLERFDPGAVGQWATLLFEKAGKTLPAFLWNDDETQEQILFKLAEWLGLDAESLSRRLSRVPVRFEDAVAPSITPVRPAGRDVVAAQGRNVFAAIGISRYRHWSELRSPVEDAVRVTELFGKLGFTLEQKLLDGDATGEAMWRLVIDDLAALGSEDSLVLFYAGRAATVEHRFQDGVLRHGYLIPADAPNKESASSWIDLDGWLRAVSLLPAKHILVIFDVSGGEVGLDPVIDWGDVTFDGLANTRSPKTHSPSTSVRDRRSRRVITSGLEQQEMIEDGGSRGSLFTRCLIEALDGDLARQIDWAHRTGTPYVTGSDLGSYLQRRVRDYSVRGQTPDFGTFSFDERGELCIPLLRK